MPNGTGGFSDNITELQSAIAVLGSGAPVTAPQASEAVQAMQAAILKMKQADALIGQLQARIGSTGVVTASGNVIPPAASANAGNTGATAPTQPPADGQVYLSAPAAGAIALVSLLVGVGGGYAAKGYLDKRKHGAKEASEPALEAPRTTYKVVDKRPNLRHPIIYAPPGGFASRADAVKYAKGLDVPYKIEPYEG